jgi:multimeric flavodoxin WrbA/uncharacterized Zn finger protein (UPF0148 family)
MIISDRQQTTKKILGIIASPRKLGNSEIIIKEISRRLPEEHELKLLRLHDFNIEPCRACYKCLFGEEKCVIDDDILQIHAAVSEADALIVAAPTYFLAPNASLKRLLDRGLSFYGLQEKMLGKPAVGIAVAGIKGKEGHTLLGVNNFLKCILADLKYSEVIYSAFPGEAALSDENLTIAQTAADSLFGAKVLPAGPHCPLCGGDSFRFLADNKVQCLLCSNRGTINTSGAISFDIQKDNHELFLSSDVAKEHKEWLKEMKLRFFEELPNLKKSRDLYKGGEFVQPVKK